MAAGENALRIVDDDEQPANPAGPEGEGIPIRISLDPMQLLLGLLMSRKGGDWYKADRISRAKLQEKYPTACRFSKTDGNIAAIDFGTTFCSLAFATVDSSTAAENLSSVEINTMPLNKVYPRVPTAILLKEKPHDARCNGDSTVSKTCDFEVVEFGYDAVTKHCQLKPTEQSKYLYFERFKMTLQQDETVHRNMTTKSSDGREFYLVEVIAFVLKYLKCQLEYHLQKTISPLKGSDFDWVITVPAIWKARGKRMMREAAYMAGLTSADPGISSFLEVGKGVPRPQETNPDKLTLALEPEAAAIYCQTMDSDKVASCCRVEGPLQSNRYVVIDIGGGTVDITVHHHDQEKGVKVIIPPVGNDCGGTMVNREFAKFLQGIVDDAGFARFLESTDSSQLAYKNAALNALLYQEFEWQKVSFGQHSSGFRSSESLTGDELCIKLSNQFVQFYSIDKIRAGVEALNDDRVQLEDDGLYIEPSKFASFYEPAIKGILECVEEVLKDLEEGIDTVYLVGGFGGCKYTYEKVFSMVKSKFANKKLRVIVPNEHKLAVAQGAVKYRLKPDVIHSRAMDASYGTDFAPEFNPLVHDTSYVGMDHTGTLRVKDVYMKYVEKGEQMSSEEVVTAELVPINNSTTTMNICLYSSFEKGVKYITTPDGNPNPVIRKIGELNVDMPNPDNLPRQERQVELTMDFSHTEIQIRARYLVTGEEVKVVADFLTTHVSSEIAQ